MDITAAVADCEALRRGLKRGLHALQSGHGDCIEIDDPRRIDGSINLESVIKPLMPTNRQWDYVIGWSTPKSISCCCVIEVHPANTQRVRDVIDKKRDMNAWQKAHAPRVHVLDMETARHLSRHTWIWVATAGPIAILPKSPQRRLLAEHGIGGPQRKVRLDESKNEAG